MSEDAAPAPEPTPTPTPKPKPQPQLRGKPVQIVKLTADHKFEMDLAGLERILSGKHKNKNVAVISVAGAFRKGKSFLLDFFLRYLNRQAELGEEWMGEDEEPLSGFSWRGGVERETTGLWMWSEPFVTKGPDGDPLVVLLMDTQGTFDSTSTMRDNATIFGLSTLISSVEVYNLSSKIQEDDLQNLQLFTEYGKLATSGEYGADTTVKPFQALRFLVRDWAWAKDHPHGNEGGEQYLNKVLAVPEAQHEELKQVRLHIRECFESLSCFLLPHIGLEVVEDEDFDGRLSAIRPVFRKHLKDLVEITLCPQNLVPKKINGVVLSCADLLTYFKSYMEMYRSDTLPEPKTALQVTAEANNLSAKEKALMQYNRTMTQLTKKGYVEAKKLDGIHETVRKDCLDMFRNVKKMGGTDFSASYLDQLTEQIDQAYSKYRELNDAKRSLAVIKTPLTLALMLLGAYILSYSWMDSLLEALWLGSLTTPLDILFWLVMFMILFYVVVKLQGGEVNQAMQAFLDLVEGLAETVWDAGLSKVAKRALDAATSRGITPQGVAASAVKKAL